MEFITLDEQLRSQVSTVARVMWGMSGTTHKLLDIAVEADFRAGNLTREAFNEFVEMIEFVHGEDKVKLYYMDELGYMVQYLMTWLEDNLEDLD